ncbi:MAG: hypothetical protein Q7S88_02035 [Candidatus Daviesbacteria bacterium]|nr:hypothetical protein [Candidatus Daviesbacteria bacterium]
MSNPESPLKLNQPIDIRPDHQAIRDQVRVHSVGSGRLQREFRLMTPEHRQIGVGLVISGLTLAGGLIGWEAGTHLNSQTLREAAGIAAYAGVAGGVASVLASLKH